MSTVRELEKSDFAAWNQLVAASPQGNVFLRAEWLEMLCDTDPDLHLLMLSCFDPEGQLIGGQAVTYVERWGMAVTAEFEFFYSGPVLAPQDRKGRAHQMAKHGEITSALAEALATRLAYVDVEAHPSFRDARPFLYAGWQVEPVYTHIWRMDDPECTWRNMNREKRRDIRRAQEQFAFGVEVGDEVLDAFLPLYHETMLKFSWRPSVKWEAIFRRRFHWMRQRDGCRLYTARTAEGELAAGVVVLLSREDETAYLWRQGSGRAYVEAGGVPALYWHAACDLAPEFPNINFGGSPEPSLSRFKDYLGAEPVLHFRLLKCNNRFRLSLLKRAQTIKDIAYNIVMPVAYGLWQRLRHGDQMAERS